MFISDKRDASKVFFDAKFEYTDGKKDTYFNVYSGEVKKESKGNVIGLKNLQYALFNER